MKRFAFLFGLSLLAGCGGSDDPLAPVVIRCSDGGASPANTVTLQCAAAASADEYLVVVELAGPSSGATTLRGVALDVVWTPTNVEFIADPAYTSPLMPNGLVAVGLFQGEQGHLVVSVQQPGGQPDVSVGPGAATVVRLRFRRKITSAFGPVPLAIDNAAAIDSSPAIQFGSGLALSSQ